MTRLQWRQSADELSAAAEPIKVRLLQQTWFPVRLFIRHRLVSNQVWFWPEFCEKASAPNVKSPYFVIIMTIIMYVCVCRRLYGRMACREMQTRLSRWGRLLSPTTHTHTSRMRRNFILASERREFFLSALCWSSGEEDTRREVEGQTVDDHNVVDCPAASRLFLIGRSCAVCRCLPDLFRIIIS